MGEYLKGFTENHVSELIEKSLLVLQGSSVQALPSLVASEA